MTGEKSRHGARSAQPGGRAPAPGQLGLVQSFLNSHFSLGEDYGADLFSSPQDLRAWLRSRELISSAAPIGPPELRRTLHVRKGLRSLVAGEAPTRELSAASVGAAVEVRFDDGAPRFVAGSAGTFAEALGLLLAISAEFMIDGRWARLKICPGHHCGWAFYDVSRNRTGRWCSMSVCGGRAKAQTHYRRHKHRAT